jgi:hypothetical protein
MSRHGFDMLRHGFDMFRHAIAPTPLSIAGLPLPVRRSDRDPSVSGNGHGAPGGDQGNDIGGSQAHHSSIMFTAQPYRVAP